MTEMLSSRPSAASTSKAPARRGRGGPSKAALGRVKLAAIALSAVAFVGSLAGVVRATPNTVRPQAAVQPAVQQQIAQAAPVAPQRPSFFAPQTQDGSFVMPTRPQMPALRPFARTRGS